MDETKATFHQCVFIINPRPPPDSDSRRSIDDDSTKSSGATPTLTPQRGGQPYPIPPSTIASPAFQHQNPFMEQFPNRQRYFLNNLGYAATIHIFAGLELDLRNSCTEDEKYSLDLLQRRFYLFAQTATVLKTMRTLYNNRSDDYDSINNGEEAIRALQEVRQGWMDMRTSNTSFLVEPHENLYNTIGSDQIIAFLSDVYYNKGLLNSQEVKNFIDSVTGLPTATTINEIQRYAFNNYPGY